MSDEELDVTEVVLRDGWAVGNPITKIDMEFLASAADAITALRAQLARREEMHDCAMKERDDATIYADEQKASADRAESDLTAIKTMIGTPWNPVDAVRVLKKARDQAEADLQAMAELKRNYAVMKDRAEAERDAAEAALAAQIEADAGVCDKHSYSNNQYVSMRMIDAAREIRAQPHDTTALDRVKSEVRADAIREAARTVWSKYDEKDASYWGESHGDIARREKARAILALLDKDATP